MEQKERKGVFGLLAKVSGVVALAIILGWLLTTVGVNWLIAATITHYAGPMIWQAQCLVGGLVTLVWSSAYWAIVFSIAIWSGIIAGGSAMGFGISAAARRRRPE